MIYEDKIFTPIINEEPETEKETGEETEKETGEETEKETGEETGE